MSVRFIVIDDWISNLDCLMHEINKAFPQSFHCISECGKIVDSLDGWLGRLNYITFNLDDIDVFVNNFLDDIDETQDIILIDLALTRNERFEFNKEITNFNGVITYTPEIIRRVKSRKPSVRVRVMSNYKSSEEYEPEIMFPKFLSSIQSEPWFGSIKYMRTFQVKGIEMHKPARDKLLSY